MKNFIIDRIVLLLVCMLWKLIGCTVTFHVNYTARHLSISVAPSEQFLVVLVVQAITLELSILSIALRMVGMLQSQVVAIST